jgi:hypothetical protein
MEKGCDTRGVGHHTKVRHQQGRKIKDKEEIIIASCSNDCRWQLLTNGEGGCQGLASIRYMHCRQALKLWQIFQKNRAS